jgi:anaerobic ribonucleoside-triphosphate reductase activating protein
LQALLHFLHAEKKHLPASRKFSVFVYSGYSAEALQTPLAILQQQALIDAIMTEPFDSQSPQTKPLRGSDNQRLLLLSELGKQHFSRYQQPNATPNKALDMMYAEGQVWLAGVPLQEDLPKLVDRLRTKGHHVLSSQKNKLK